MSIYTAEFVGTLFLILLGNGVVGGVVLKDTKNEGAGWLTIVLAWGLAVAMAIYAVGSISGAHLNPAVTLALAYLGKFPADQVIGYITAQLSGAFAGSILVWIFYGAHWKRTSDSSAKLAVFCTAPAIRSYALNFINEALATAVLIFGILFIGENKFTEGLNPLIVGLLIVSVGLSLGGTTGFAINPARDLGPRLAHFILPIPGKRDSDWSYAWIPVLGPIVGGLLGAILYEALY